MTGHENPYRMTWDSLMLVVFLYIVILVPYLIAFNITEVCGYEMHYLATGSTDEAEVPFMS